MANASVRSAISRRSSIAGSKVRPSIRASANAASTSSTCRPRSTAASRTSPIAGVVEGEWPASSSRSIFYPSSLLRDLGWPAESDRRAAARAVFDDLLRLARDEVSVSVFALEHDAIVRPSPFVEDLASAGLPLAAHRQRADVRVRFRLGSRQSDPSPTLTDARVMGRSHGSVEWCAAGESRRRESACGGARARGVDDGAGRHHRCGRARVVGGRASGAVGDCGSRVSRMDRRDGAARRIR